MVNRPTQVGGISYTWDANGNLTNDGQQSYLYDHGNRLKSVSQGANTTDFSYNGQGDRLVENSTHFVMDLNTGLTQALQNENNTYLYGNERIAQDQGSETGYFLGDVLGSSGAGTTVYGFTNEYSNKMWRGVFLHL